MNNFLLFIYKIDSPDGGMYDYAGSFDIEKDAHLHCEKMKEDSGTINVSYHILDVKNENIIFSGGATTSLASVAITKL